MAERVAKLYRQINGIYTSNDSALPTPGTVVVTLSNGAGAAVTRRSDGATILAAQSTPIPASAPGVWEFDHTFLNLNLAYDYYVWFSILDTHTGESDRQPILISGVVDANSRANLRRQIGRLMQGRSKFGYGPILTGAPSTVTANFIKRFSDNWFVGKNLFVVDGLGAGQEAFITQSIRGSGEVTVEPSWGVIPAAGSFIEIWSDGLGVEDVNDAINLAISDVSRVFYVRETWPISVADFSSDRYSVPIPEEFRYISAFRYQQPQMQPWNEHTFHGEQNSYTTRDGRLYVNRVIPSDVTVGYIDGYRRVRSLQQDSDICDVPSAFVIFFAAFQLEAGDARGQNLDPEQHSGRAGNWLRQAMIEREEVKVRWMPNTMEVI